MEPGWYTLSVELAGFTKFVQENIEVQSRGDVTVNVTLQPGALAESITVAESPVAVQFNSTNTILTLDTKLADDYDSPRDKLGKEGWGILHLLVPASQRGCL